MMGRPSMKSSGPSSPDVVLGALQIRRMRGWIADAVQAGAAPTDLVLNVNYRDASLLKRHADVEVGELAFSDGQMLFLGVPVQEGSPVPSHLGPVSAAE